MGNLNEGTEQQHINVHTRPLLAVTRTRNMGKELDTLCLSHYSKIYHLLYLMKCEDQDKQNSNYSL